LIWSGADGVIEEVLAWQGWPLEKTYVILYLDALVVKVKQEGRIANRSISKTECRHRKLSTGRLHRKSETFVAELRRTTTMAPPQLKIVIIPSITRP